jgi:hypothetical protein
VPEDLQALAARVEAAHRPGGPKPRVTAIDAAMQWYVKAKNADQGQVDITLQYLESQAPESKKPTSLMHYEVVDKGTPIVRGSDRYGPWQLDRDEARDLLGADAAQDLAQFERHRSLVKQLLRFLSPGDVLRSLKNPSPVAEETLAVAIDKKVECRTVSGELAAFPLLQQAGEDAPVVLKIWIDKGTDLLRAVDAWPLRDGKKDEARGERIVLGTLRPRGGLIVPLQLEHLFRQPDGTLALQSQANFTSLDLAPTLRAEDFERRKVVAKVLEHRRK